MTDSLTAPPPPYRTDTPPAERSHPPAASITVLSNSNLEGIRNSILDNVPVLFILGHNGKKTLPKEFLIVTVKAPPNPTMTNLIPGRIHACLMFCETVYKGRQEARLFVQSPQRERMEETLASLLQKMQEMLGRRWQLPLSCARPAASYVYLES